MDIKNIKMLARLMTESDLSAIEVAEGDSKVRLERNFRMPASGAINYAPMARQDMPIAEPPVSKVSVSDSGIDFNDITEVKSPMIGVFYASPSPSDPSFVSIGSKVKKGDTLCIIEAMKIMNEIVADRDGEVVDICVSNGQLVEFSQVLFKIF